MKKTFNKIIYVIPFVLLSHLPFIEKEDYFFEGEILNLHIEQDTITYLLKQNSGVNVVKTQSVIFYPELFGLNKGDYLKETRTSKQSIFGKGLEIILGVTTEILDNNPKVEYKINKKIIEEYKSSIKSV